MFLSTNSEGRPEMARKTLTTLAVIGALVFPASAGAVGGVDDQMTLTPQQSGGFLCSYSDPHGITITRGQQLRIVRYQIGSAGAWRAVYKRGTASAYAVHQGQLVTVTNTGRGRITVAWNCPET
jgi:hypothetical protein